MSSHGHQCLRGLQSASWVVPESSSSTYVDLARPLRAPTWTRGLRRAGHHLSPQHRWPPGWLRLQPCPRATRLNTFTNSHSPFAFTSLKASGCSRNKLQCPYGSLGHRPAVTLRRSSVTAVLACFPSTNIPDSSSHLSRCTSCHLHAPAPSAWLPASSLPPRLCHCVPREGLRASQAQWSSRSRGPSASQSTVCSLPSTSHWRPVSLFPCCSSTQLRYETELLGGAR